MDVIDIDVWISTHIPTKGDMSRWRHPLIRSDTRWWRAYGPMFRIHKFRDGQIILSLKPEYPHKYATWAGEWRHAPRPNSVIMLHPENFYLLAHLYGHRLYERSERVYLLFEVWLPEE